MEREYTVTTGEQGRVYCLIDEYFDNLERTIDAAHDNLLSQNPNLLLHPHFERRVLGVRMPEWVPAPVRPDDYFHMLLYKDKVVAVVTEQRNDMNYVQFSLFDNLESVLKER